MADAFLTRKGSAKQEKTVTPSKNTLIVTPDSGKLLSKVTVNGDADLVAANIKSGVNIFGVAGTLVEGSVTIDGEKVQKPLNLTSTNINIPVSTLPYFYSRGSAVILNGQIHIMGGTNGNKNHYKWDGSAWGKAIDLPYEFTYGSAVVLNNEIHIMGGNYTASYRKNHYKWNGTSWVSVSTLPYDFYQGSAVVLNNEIHILGSTHNSGYRSHYKWDGASWTSLRELSQNFYTGSAVIFKDEIHVLGGANSKDHSIAAALVYKEVR